MTKPDQEGLIVKYIINRDIAGARGIILLSSELPPGKAHLLHRHPNAEQIMYVLEGACLALSEGGGDAPQRGRRGVHRPGRVARRSQRQRPTGRNARDLRGGWNFGGGRLRRAPHAVRARLNFPTGPPVTDRPVLSGRPDTPDGLALSGAGHHSLYVFHRRGGGSCGCRSARRLVIHDAANARPAAGDGHLAPFPDPSSIRVISAEWSQPPLPLASSTPNLFPPSAATGSGAPYCLPAARAIPRSLRWYATLPPGVNSCDKNFSPLTSRTLLDARPPERSSKTLPGVTPAFVPKTMASATAPMTSATTI